jgi:acyl carrier protein
MEQIERELRQFVVENFLFGEGENHFSNDDSFLEKGLVDSMGILTLVDFAQQRFGISIADEELIPENWDSVRRMAGFVQGKLSVPK